MINFDYNLNKNLVLKRNLFSNKDKNFIFDYQLKKLNEQLNDNKIIRIERFPISKFW